MASSALPFFSLLKVALLTLLGIPSSGLLPCSYQGLCLKGRSFDAIGREKMVSISVSEKESFWKAVQKKILIY